MMDPSATIVVLESDVDAIQKALYRARPERLGITLEVYLRLLRAIADREVSSGPGT